MVNIIKPNDLPEYSLVCMFSRLWVLKKWFEEFSKLEIDKEKTEIAKYSKAVNCSANEASALEPNIKAIVLRMPPIKEYNTTIN